MKKNLLKYWPLIIIFFIWLVYASPFFIKGLLPFPSTFLSDFFPPWNVYSGYEGPVKNNAMPDIISQIYPWKTLVIESWKQGEVPLWNPYSFSGTPLLANYQSAALSPLNLLYFVFSFNFAWSIQIILQPLLAGIFAYMYIRSIGISRTGSLISSIAFMFCGFLTSWMAYGTLGYAILILPLSLFSIERYFRTKRPFYLVILALSIPLSFFSGHFQMSLYFLGFVFLYLSFKLLTTKQYKDFVISLLSIVAGIMVSSVQLIPSIEFYMQSVRSELFQKNEVIPWHYLPTFIAPDFFGNPVTRNDWLGHYAEWNFYIGVIPLILAAFALIKRNVFIIFFAFAFLLTMLLAFQSPLLDLLVFLKIPVLSTSAASRIIVLTSFSAIALCGFGFDNLLKSIQNREYKKIYIFLLINLVIFIILWFVAFKPSMMPSDERLIAYSNLRLPTLIFIIFTIILLIKIFIKKKIVSQLFASIIIFLVALDLLRFSIKWQPFDPKDLMYKKTPIATFINERSENYDRGLGNYGAEAAILDLNIGSVEGYDPLYIKNYGELVTSAEAGVYKSPSRSVVSFPKYGEYASEALNLLGVKYIVHKVADSNMPWTFPVWQYEVDHFVMLYEDPHYQIFENQRAFPRAYIVSDYEVISEDKETISAIFNKELDLRNTVILDRDININPSRGEASIVEYNANSLKVGVETDGDSILVLSDPYYPGWNAYVNGKKEEILQANHAFRAVLVPGGQSKVEFKYEPSSLRYGVYLTALGIVFVILIFIYKIYYEKRD